MRRDQVRAEEHGEPGDHDDQPHDVPPLACAPCAEAFHLPAGADMVRASRQGKWPGIIFAGLCAMPPKHARNAGNEGHRPAATVNDSAKTAQFEETTGSS